MLGHLTLQPQYVGSRLAAILSAFLLGREASCCTAKTHEHYQYTVGSFVTWLKAQGIDDVDGITPRHMRAYPVLTRLDSGLRKEFL